ncbi:TIMELESS-interacting protein isoform X1 [Brachyistius frenatus]|uniref:TIMELESS-interacting protein isoform X1 n=1 Tax=Brachyistius frenatus TaxID=100188 RepID=UPI0037E84804
MRKSQEKGRKDDRLRYSGVEDEMFPPLPPPVSPGGAGAGGQEDGDHFANAEDGDMSKLADVPAAKRRGVKRPQPKLDSQRLISERGLPALRTLFDNVRFKGKGHEAEDLRLLMQKMENWAHRLYPKLQFEDFIDKVEKLGAKKEVQTCLKRIRLDMPLTHEDFMGKDDEEEVRPEVEVFGDPDPFGRGSFVNDPEEPVHSTPALAAPPLPPAPPPPSLTEEQRTRMELNRRRALERKLARQQLAENNGEKGAEKVEDLDDTQQQQQQQQQQQPPSEPRPKDTETNVLDGSADQEEEVEEEKKEVEEENKEVEEEVYDLDDTHQQQQQQPPSEPPPKDTETNVLDGSADQEEEVEEENKEVEEQVEKEVEEEVEKELEEEVDDLDDTHQQQQQQQPPSEPPPKDSETEIHCVPEHRLGDDRQDDDKSSPSKKP